MCCQLPHVSLFRKHHISPSSMAILEYLGLDNIKKKVYLVHSFVDWQSTQHCASSDDAWHHGGWHHSQTHARGRDHTMRQEAREKEWGGGSPEGLRSSTWKLSEDITPWPKHLPPGSTIATPGSKLQHVSLWGHIQTISKPHWHPTLLQNRFISKADAILDWGVLVLQPVFHYPLRFGVGRK
jgi:hypothetical protein